MVPTNTILIQLLSNSKGCHFNKEGGRQTGSSLKAGDETVQEDDWEDSMVG